MKARWRALYNLLVGASAIFCVVMIAMWIACFGHPQILVYDWLDITQPHVELRSISWVSGDGFMSMTYDRRIADTPDQAAGWKDEESGFLKADVAFDFSGTAPYWNLRHGFFCQSVQTRDNSLGVTYATKGIGVPYWFLAATSALLSIVWIGRWRRRRRIAVRVRAGCCARCGYDLRATPHRCPECGAVRRKAAN